MIFILPSKACNTSALHHICIHPNHCFGVGWRTRLTWHLQRSVVIPAIYILCRSLNANVHQHIMSSHKQSIGQEITLSMSCIKALKGIICYIFLSEDPSVRQHAHRNVRIALSASRYTRQCMIKVLESTEFSSKEEFSILLEQSKLTCIPYPCPNQEKDRMKIFRHCDDRGHLIHLQVRLP